MEQFIALLLLALKKQLGAGLSVDNSIILQSLDDIKAELAEIKSLVGSGTDMQINLIPISPSYAHSGTWTTQLNTLAAITDGNTATATGYGEVGGAVNRVGYFTLDLGSPVTTPLSVVELIVSIQNSSDSAAFWGIEAEQELSWQSIWGVHRTAPSSGDTPMTLNLVLKGAWQRIRLVAKDTGSYSARIKIYSLRVFTIS